jgi:EmrB/QacA subfamily drug resistance transporter
MTTTEAPPNATDRSRWIALYVLCLGALMIVLDTNIVNVALPSVRDDLGFSQASLAWVVNAYTLTFGGFLLLSGKLGDIYGRRKVFLIGVTAFSAASVLCGLAQSPAFLVVGRALQGLAGAVVSAVALGLITGLFQQPADRAKAMGTFGFVMSSGGAIGVLLGGILTATLSWHWIFLVNVPIGVAVTILCLRVLPPDGERDRDQRLDLPGAVLITSALVVAVYGVVGAAEHGWTASRTLALLALAVLLLGAFVLVQTRVAHPLVPLRLFRSRNLSVSNVVGMLWAAAMFAWFFLSALYLQQVLGFGPMKVGLAYLPTSLVMAGLSLGLADRLVMRFGIKPTLVVGLSLAAVSLLLFSRAPVDGSFATDVLPSMLVLGCGAGIAFTPVLLASMGDVQPEDAGLASGLVNTSFMMGGALGLAILVTVADGRTQGALRDGASSAAALTSGYHVAFLIGAAAAALAAALGGLLLRTPGTENAPAEVGASSEQLVEPQPVSD